MKISLRSGFLASRVRHGQSSAAQGWRGRFDASRVRVPEGRSTQVLCLSRVASGVRRPCLFLRYVGNRWLEPPPRGVHCNLGPSDAGIPVRSRHQAVSTRRLGEARVRHAAHFAPRATSRRRCWRVDRANDSRSLGRRARSLSLTACADALRAGGRDTSRRGPAGRMANGTARRAALALPPLTCFIGPSRGVPRRRGCRAQPTRRGNVK